MGLTEYLIIAFVFFFVGMIADRKLFKKGDLDTDTCVEYLKSRGYWVKLNVPVNYKKEWKE